MAKTKPVNAPTAVLLSKRGLSILQRRANLYRPMLGLGLVAGVLAFASLLIAVIPAAGCIWLGVNRFRWRSMAEVTRSTPIDDYLLTDDADLRWMAWAIELEPRAKLLMQQRRPDGQFRSVDVREISACFAHDTYDVPKRAPYHGDVDRAIDDLEDRRVKEKRALWQATP